MFGSEMVTSLSEILRNELVCWQMRKSDGACTMSGCGWLKRRNTASFSQDLGNATKMTENVPMFMTPQKLQSAPNFWMDCVPMQIANWLTRFSYEAIAAELYFTEISNWITCFFHRSFQKGCLIVLIFCKVRIFTVRRFYCGLRTILTPITQVYATTRHVHIGTCMSTPAPLYVMDF